MTSAGLKVCEHRVPAGAYCVRCAEGSTKAARPAATMDGKRQEGGGLQTNSGAAVAHSTALALPDPQTLAAGQVPQLVSRVTVLRQELAERNDVAGANELRRRLAAYERYVADKKARAALEAESRRTEVLIGQLLGPTSQGERTDLSSVDKLPLHTQERVWFRSFAANADLVEDRLAAGVTARAKILTAIERVKMAANGADIESSTRVGDFRDVLAGGALFNAFVGAVRDGEQFSRRVPPLAGPVLRVVKNGDTQ